MPEHAGIASNVDCPLTVTEFVARSIVATAEGLFVIDAQPLVHPVGSVNVMLAVASKFASAAKSAHVIA